MWGIFESKDKKIESELRDRIVSAIRENVSDMQAEINHIHQNLEVKYRKLIAHRIIKYVIYNDRTSEAAEKLAANAKKYFDLGKEAEAFALVLSSRLIVCGAMLLKLKGRNWIDASFEFSMLEGLVRAYIESCGYSPWPTLYVQDVSFDRYRLEFIAAKEAEEAAAIAEYEREKLTQLGNNGKP